VRGLTGTVAAVALAWLVVSAGPARGQNSPETRATLGGLRGVAVYVDSLSPDMPQKGITRGMIMTKVETRLREARILVLRTASEEVSPGDPLLYVGVTSIFDGMGGGGGCVCAIRMELTQTVRLFRNPGYVVFHVPTWGVGGVGVYSKRWREELIEDVLAYTDEFIDAFYRANPVAEQTRR
jgi:hypothetical protein